MVGGRDSLHGVFDPWVRWDLGLDRIRSFSVVVVVSSPPSKSSKIGKNTKTVFDDETYIEKRLGIVKHVPV